MADPASETGTGVIGSLAGTIIFLTLLLFACQVLASLYARSTVSAAGFDAARAVASRRVDHDDMSEVAAAEAEAERNLRSLLGPLGADAQLTWAVDQEVVRLRVEVASPAFVPTSVLPGPGTRQIDRTFVVRVEDLR